LVDWTLGDSLTVNVLHSPKEFDEQELLFLFSWTQLIDMFQLHTIEKDLEITD
jgi:hypothetical protein